MNLSSLKQKYWLSVILVLAIIGLMIAGINYCQGYTQQTNAPQKPSSTNFLRVKGNKIIDEKGNEIILHGVTVDPFPYFGFKGEDYTGVYSIEKIDGFNKNLYSAYLTEQDMAKMKELGVNVMRKQISFYHLAAGPCQYNDGVLQQLDYLLNISSKYGIYVIPSLTDAAQNSEQQLAHPENEASKAYNNTEHLWTEPEFRKRIISTWKYMASRYKDNPWVAGYDIINEPSAPAKEDLHSFYSAAISEIRKVDAKHIIILEKQQFHNPEFLFGGEYNDNNIMLSLHRYPGEKFNPKAKYETYNDFYKGMGDFLKNEEVKGRPLYVGEFGIHYSKDEAHKWLDNFMQVMNLYGVHYTFFSYKNVYGYWDKLEGGSKGLYLSTETLLLVPPNIPKEQVIDWAEKRKDQLLTERFQIDLKIKEILKQRLNGPAVIANPPFVQVQGKKIITENGKEIFLRGVNLNGWLLWEGGGLELPNNPEHQLRRKMEEKGMSIIEVNRFFDSIVANLITQEDFFIAKSIGLNYVRLPFHHRYVDENKLAKLDEVISWAKNAGIYIMLDMHAAPGSQNTDYHSDSDGNAYLWQNTSHQDDFVRLWKIIAQKYKNESSILGYELLNEPVAPTNSQLTSLYQRAITAIRAIDTKHIIFLDGNIYAGNFIDFNPVELGTNIVYIFHSYSSAQEAANSWQQEYLPFQNKHNVPIICNEYGGACEYGTDSLTTFFQTKNIPYAPWGYKLTYNTLNKTPFYYVGTNHPWRTQLLNKIPDEVQAKREQMKNEMLNVLNQGSLSDQCKQKLINILNDQGTLTQKEFRRVAQNYPGDAREFKNLSKQFAAIKFSYTVAAIVSIFQSKSESEKTQLMESLKTQYWEKGDANW